VNTYPLPGVALRFTTPPSAAEEGLAVAVPQLELLLCMVTERAVLKTGVTITLPAGIVNVVVAEYALLNVTDVLPVCTAQ